MSLTIPTYNHRRYFRIERLLFKIGGICLDGNETTAYKIYSLTTLFLFNLTYPFILSVDLFKQNFNDAIDSWFYVITTAMVVSVLSAMYPNRVQLGNLLNKLEKHPFIINFERGGDEEEKLIEGWITFSYMQDPLYQHTADLGVTEEKYPEIAWKYLGSSLNDAVNYHLEIIGIATEMQEIFSNVMLFIYLFALAMLCLEVYRASLLPMNDVRTLRLFVEALTAIFHSGMICYSGERMTHESQEVANAALEADFVGTDLRFQKSLILIIGRSQNSIRIKAGKLIETSLVTFAWIVRTSYSAYMVLRNTNAQK